MHVYRPLGRVAAISFDLDDTLYDNRPVIERAEQEAVAFLQRYHPGLSQLQADDFLRLRNELREQDPEIYHDTTRWRWRAVHLALSRLGMNEAQAQEGADVAMTHFARWRSAIPIPDETHRTLQALAQHYPLVAITNGNADPAACGLGDYFQFVLRSGQDGRSKPYQDMYLLAAQRLGVTTDLILHVGDDLITDVAGALDCGLQACWFNDHQRSLTTIGSDSHSFPHIEISRLASLTALL